MEDIELGVGGKERAGGNYHPRPVSEDGSQVDPLARRRGVHRRKEGTSLRVRLGEQSDPKPEGRQLV